MVIFNRRQLRPGLIFSVKGTNLLSILISTVLSRGFNKLLPEVTKIVPVCPCHDGIVVEVDEQFYIGESRPFKARLTSLDTYEEKFESNICLNPRIFEVKIATKIEEYTAAEYWLKHVNGTLYDFMAFPYLSIKNLLMDNSEKVAGWEWAHWCTEGVAEAYCAALGYDIYNKTNPTPLTTIKRVLEGVFRDVSDQMFIDMPPLKRAKRTP